MLDDRSGEGAPAGTGDGVITAVHGEGRVDETAVPTARGGLDGDADVARVLVVEDDSLVRDHAVRLIRQLGYTVQEARSGEEALQLLARDPRCDVIFSDVVMPSMSGGQFVQAAKLLLPDLGVVFVTGYHADPTVEYLRREGGAIVIAKPYRRRVVAQALSEILLQRRNT